MVSASCFITLPLLADFGLAVFVVSSCVFLLFSCNTDTYPSTDFSVKEDCIYSFKYLSFPSFVAGP